MSVSESLPSPFSSWSTFAFQTSLRNVPWAGAVDVIHRTGGGGGDGSLLPPLSLHFSFYVFRVPWLWLLPPPWQPSAVWCLVDAACTLHHEKGRRQSGGGEILPPNVRDRARASYNRHNSRTCNGNQQRQRVIGESFRRKWSEREREAGWGTTTTTTTTATDTRGRLLQFFYSGN